MPLVKCFNDFLLCRLYFGAKKCGLSSICNPYGQKITRSVCTLVKHNGAVLLCAAVQLFA